MSKLHNYLQKNAKHDTGAIAYLAMLDHLEKTNPDIAHSIIHELEDQRSFLKMIASENYSSLAVQLAMGNLLTDKYAEGYAHHRFYAGCDNVDSVEDAATNELKKLFACDSAYVQPHSGADANMVAFWGILVQKVQNKEVEKLGKKTLEELTPEEYERIRQLMMNQKLMGMSLNSGGHLTHGYKHNISSKMMQSVVYDVNPETQMLDYAALSNLVKKEKPTILLAGYSAYPRRINFAKMREIADSVGAVFMVDMAHFAGLVAGKAFIDEYNPIPYADVVTSTTHKTLRGPRGGFVLCREEFADTMNKGCPLVLGGPLPHVMAAKAIAFREANTPQFKDYAKQIILNAKALANRLIEKGLKLVTGGTENHLLIIDLTQFNLTGRQGENLLRNALITANRNTIPFDKNGPWYTTGIRLGTPALTTLGMKQGEMQEIADVIVDILTHSTIEMTPKGPSKSKANTDTKILEKAQIRITDLLKHFRLYPEIDINLEENLNPLEKTVATSHNNKR